MNRTDQTTTGAGSALQNLLDSIESSTNSTAMSSQSAPRLQVHHCDGARVVVAVDSTGKLLGVVSVDMPKSFWSAGSNRKTFPVLNVEELLDNAE